MNITASNETIYEQIYEKIGIFTFPIMMLLTLVIVILICVLIIMWTNNYLQKRLELAGKNMVGLDKLHAKQYTFRRNVLYSSIVQIVTIGLTLVLYITGFEINAGLALQLIGLSVGILGVVLAFVTQSYFKTVAIIIEGSLMYLELYDFKLNGRKIDGPLMFITIGFSRLKFFNLKDMQEETIQLETFTKYSIVPYGTAMAPPRFRNGFQYTQTISKIYRVHIYVYGR